MAGSEFGQAVRRWRDQRSPEAAGLPAGGQRRAAGLRREELAMLAGISVDYVTRLEQGRAANPSAQVVEALGRALRLAPAERVHLFRLARLVPPGPETVPTYIPPSVQRLLDRLPAHPSRSTTCPGRCWWPTRRARPCSATRPGGAASSGTGCGGISSARAPGPGARRRICPRVRPRWSPTCARRPPATQPTSSYGGWSRNCTATASGSPGCGI